MVESPCDGIGRHASFRNSCLRRVGSSPTGGNNKIETFTRFSREATPSVSRSESETPKVLLGSLH